MISWNWIFVVQAKLGNQWVMTLVWVPFVLVFAIVQLSAAEYVIYGHLTTIDDSLSLNLIRCLHPLITLLCLREGL